MNPEDEPQLGSATDILGPGGIVARRLSGYEPRPQQVELAAAVERSLKARRHLLAEAGTGVGKSFAYLIPAVLDAAQSAATNGPIVVSTRTIALQEQLDRKDLPFLQSVLPLEWSAVTAIGRNNYVCLRRMKLADRESNTMFPDAEEASDLQRIIDWSSTTLEGTRQSLDQPVIDKVWDEVKAEHGNCLNRACKFYDACLWQKARRRMETAQILVVNHALYIADVALRAAGARYLPAHSIVIFDEAHHLERVATEGLGRQFGRSTILWHLRRLHPQRAKRSLLALHGTPRSRTLVSDLRSLTDEWFGSVQATMTQRMREGGSAMVPLEDRVLDEPFSELVVDLQREVAAIAGDIVDTDLRIELQARATGLGSLMATIASLCAPTSANDVRWVEQTRGGPVLRSAPLDPSETLRQHVFASPRTAILVSATLGSPSDRHFGWLRGRLGIDDADGVRVGSPFDYRTAVEVEIPRNLPDPGRDAKSHRVASVETARQSVLDNDGHALVLCTSWAQVKDMATGMRNALAEADIPLLVQGEAPFRVLLQQKRETPRSVLIGTDSFWEGIDIPGEALTLLIITRLPFAPPDHPLTKARNRTIEERGGSPFGEQSLPEAILRFRQGFGRLIRTAKDHGRVLILDPRIRLKGYGARFLEALPEGSLD